MIKHGGKGLYSFIDEIRCCKTKEEEETKVLQEFMKIKKSFSDKNITNYKRKNNIWKLVYCHILGYEISVSYFDIIKLISSKKYSDKYCGYTALSLLLNENNEVLNILVSTIKEDIKCKDEQINALALNFICHKINDLIIENLYDDILQIVTFNYVYKPYVRKKAFSCISNIYKKRHDLLLGRKGDMNILKFLDRNLNEINFSNVFSFLNLIYITTLIYKKYEKMYNLKKNEKKRNRKSKYEEEDLNLCKREYLKGYDKTSSYINPSKSINLHIKDEITKKNRKNFLLKESNFFYDDINRVDKFLEIESDCSFNYEEVNYEELKKHMYKYIHYILKILDYIVNENYKMNRGAYYNNRKHPFLLIKCLQMLQLFDIDSMSTSIINNINEILHTIIYEPYKKLQGRKNDESEIGNHDNEDARTIFKKNFGRSNKYNNHTSGNKIVKNDKSAIYTEYGIIYECSNLLNFLKYKAEDRNRDIIICLLMSSLDTKKSNIVYVILNSLSKLKMNIKIYNMLESHIMHIIHLLNHDDLTIKLQTFNILFNMCNKENWKLLLNVFLHHLPNIDTFIQNEIIIKITILSEQFSPDLFWYIDIVFKIIEITHKFILPEVWFRLVQIVTGFVEDEEKEKTNDLEYKNRENREFSEKRKTLEKKKVQKYAALKSYKYLSKNITNIQLLIELCSYLIGSFGYLIKDKVTIRQQYNVLEKYFSFVCANRKCIILMAMMKLLFYDNSIINSVRKVLNECTHSSNLELQTRACEFWNLLKLNNSGMIIHLLKHMPLYNTKKVHEIFLIKRLFETNKHAIIEFSGWDDFQPLTKEKGSSFEKEQYKRKEQHRHRHRKKSNNNREGEKYKDKEKYKEKKKDIDADKLKNDMFLHSSESEKRELRKKKNRKHRKSKKEYCSPYSSNSKKTPKFNSISESSNSFNSVNSSHLRSRFRSHSHSHSHSDSRSRSHSHSLSQSNFLSRSNTSEEEDASIANRSNKSECSTSNESSKCDGSIKTDEPNDSDEEPDDMSSKSAETSSAGSSTSSRKRLFKLLHLQKANNLNDLWLNACLLNKSVFVKNHLISILIKQTYQDNKGIIVLYIKNISPKPIKLASINTETCNNIHVKAQKIVYDENINTEEVFPVKLFISVSNIFYKIPDVTFNLVAPNGSPVSFTCKLPILITRFIKENKMNEQTFKNYWKMLTQMNNEDIKMGVPKFSKKYFFSYLINVFNFYTLKIGMFICASGYLNFSDSDRENKILIFVKIRYKVKGCQISVVSNVKNLNSYINKIFEIYLIKNNE